jgi:XRE family transcriptional regulator, aerobic/anaerobic benzoate catabolism transcriptional regulator
VAATRKAIQDAAADSIRAPLTRVAYLRMLGARVRDARARHGMTRRMLARDSGISERYLAELESGRGNFSIVLLRRLADAIDVPLSELVDEEPPAPVEYALLAERLRRLNPGQLGEAANLLSGRYGDMTGRLDRIALIGLRGAGKSTLGAQLAAHLGWQFVELSREIESEAGVAVGEIFDLWGQAAYRRYERRALERLLRIRIHIVIAAGGGVVSEPATLERLLDSCWTVWLKATPSEHWERVIRQGDLRVREGTEDAQALADMRRILAQRDALYGKADARLTTSGKTVRQSLKELLSLADRRQRRAAKGAK